MIMNMAGAFHFLAYIVKMLLLETPDHSAWTATLLWIARLITFSLILRTYIVPFLLARMSNHIRIRSISLRSIRGLYIRKGTLIWRVDRIRISYRWSSVEGHSRLSLKIEGLKLEVGKNDSRLSSLPFRGRRRNTLTLADFAPSPVAHRIWLLISSVYSLVEPSLRPLVRTYVVASLRLLIRFLPVITQALDFDLSSAIVTLTDLPETKIVIDEAKLNTSLVFTHLDNVLYAAEREPQIMERPTRSFSMAAWKSRLKNGFSRAWDRAWEKIQGTVSVSLKLNNVMGLTGEGPLLKTFLRLPGAINLSASVRFNPQRGLIDSHGFSTSLNMGEIDLSIDAVRSIVESFKMKIRSDSGSAFFDVSLSPSSLVSPKMPLLSPASPCAPVSPSSLFSYEPSITSPLPSETVTPNSPFLEVLSASMRPRRSRQPPPPKLKDLKNQSWLSLLMSADIQIPTIKLKSCLNREETYEACIRQVQFVVKLSDGTNPLHRQWLGQKTNSEDNLESNAYTFSFGMNGLILDRIKRNSTEDHSRLVNLGSIEIVALISHWPSPLLVAPSFIRGDPNAPLLVVRADVREVSFSEHLEFLQKLLAPVQKPPPVVPLHSPSLRFPIPRLALDVHCGKISGRLVYSNSTDDKPFAVELRTDGFSFSAFSHFLPKSFSMQRNRTSSSFADGLSLQMDFQLLVVLKATFVRVRELNDQSYRYSKLPTSALYLLDDPPLLSLETVEIRGQGNALGDTQGDEDDIVYVDLSSTFFDAHCSVDVVGIELWHANVIAAVVKLLSVFRCRQVETTSSPRLLDRLPIGCFTTVSVARFILFVTAPDLNPNDDLDLSRGLALRTGFSVQYCALHEGHVQRFRGLPMQSQTRHKLYLPEERLVAAVAAAKASPITQLSCAFLRVSTWDLSLRSAVATQYAVDDPHIVERDDPTPEAKECLQIRTAKAEIDLSGKRGSDFSNISDNCQVKVDIPYVRGQFQLAHVYGALLAFRTLGLLSQSHRPRHTSSESSNGLLYRIQGNVKTAQIFFGLPKQKLAIRIDSASSHSSPDGLTRIKWNTFFVWVVVPPNVNKWDGNGNERWEELGRLQEWDVSLPRLGGEISSISVQGDSGRFRIPFGYVLADLIQAIGITIKCSRHLMRIVATSLYTNMSVPEAEAAKSIPHLALRVRCLSLEASDDSLESKLNLIWRAGSEASKQRLHREEAFLHKISTILAADTSDASSLPLAQDLEYDYNFSANYSVPIEDARQRLYQVHAADWNLAHRLLKEARSRSEEVTLQWLGGVSPARVADIPNLVPVSPVDCTPPLFRIMLNGLSLNATPPSFPINTLPDFLHERGRGSPRDTQFSMLIPMHLSFSLSSLRMTLRDYPLPLVDIPPNTVTNISAWEFDTDLVVAEEMGTALSVDWIDCGVVESHYGIQGAAPLSISVPKTIMPVKTYANPNIRVTTSGVTAFSWGVSYGAATQDLMKVVDTLSSSPRDSSPGLGFWDKMRLVFHWTVRVSFKSDVRLHMKGSRDPYNVNGNGAGFALCWHGNPNLVVDHKNEDRELIQIISDTMLIAIPKLATSTLNTTSQNLYSAQHERCPFQKICAKFSSGVRFGVGFGLERSCGLECHECSGTAFRRRCRLFHFRSHYEVKLEKKQNPPVLKSPEDSYNGFRSDFIHLSISLSSSVRSTRSGTHIPSPSSLHLTPKAFAHFWSWWSLFDSVLSLPIRQGSYHPERSLSPKFGRHLATLKYRIYVARLFITHAYIDDSRETWVDGLTSFVGVKAMINEFHADMHQRDQETNIPGQIPGTFKVLRNKPFYAAEVVLKGLDLRAMLATFIEPLKQSVPVTSPAERSNHRTRNDLLAVDPSSKWIDPDDFVETDWSPDSSSTVHLLPVVVCPRITYFKRNPKAQKAHEQSTKFGAEDTHVCLLGKAASILQVQVGLASDRIAELRRYLKRGRQDNRKTGPTNDVDSGDQNKKMVALLEDYINHLREADTTSDGVEAHGSHSYHMPFDKVSPHEWSEFDNVYHIHCPKVFMDSAIRDILLKYYYCSRARRGLEYRMATRAVKFIRDQAKAVLATEINENKSPSPASSAQAAAQALRKILKGDSQPKLSVEGPSEVPSQAPGTVDPLNGWSDGVSLWKSHFCLLLKPQIVLRTEGIPESVCVLAAVQAKLQSFAIMDDSNVEDPISGKVMSRNYSSLTGLQAFSPATLTRSGDGCVPLEVLIDFRCDNSDFDRLVPQTDATFHYDKFNRLRLRNNVTSVGRTAPDQSTLVNDNHLQNQTDLIQVHIPRFTVSASDQHFQAISNIVTKLVLFSDAAHKTRSDRLETLLFTYDFTDLSSAANVVADLQGRLRTALETERTLEDNRNLVRDGTKLQMLKLKAHNFLLAEELNFIFEAIKLAQDQMDDQTDQKSAVLLHASSSEISWRMLDEDRILAKLAVRAIDFSWLSRQDSSTVNNLDVGDLQAFDGSPHATWTEILCKHDEPASHPLLKKGLFILANWTVLAPVGGITIYQEFDLNLHPMRLQIDARLGRRIMEYLWPARRTRNQTVDIGFFDDQNPTASQHRSRSSLDSPRALEDLRQKPQQLTPPPLRALGTSRSFTDLRSSASEVLHPPKPRRNLSSDTRRALTLATDLPDDLVYEGDKAPTRDHKFGDAAEMKTRSSQKTFVLVRISSLHLLLSIMKEESFECRDARIRTRQLEYRNQTWSFEELVNQFIPSDMSWRGWVKMVFHQPLLPVLPVARELISKTKWIASKGAHLEGPLDFPKLPRSNDMEGDSLGRPVEQRARSRSPHHRWRKGRRKPETSFTSASFSTEHESSIEQDSQNGRPNSRARMLSLFNRPSSHPRKSTESSNTSQSSSSHQSTVIK